MDSKVPMRTIKLSEIGRTSRRQTTFYCIINDDSDGQPRILGKGKTRDEAEQAGLYYIENNLYPVAPHHNDCRRGCKVDYSILSRTSAQRIYGCEKLERMEKLIVFQQMALPSEQGENELSL